MVCCHRRARARLPRVLSFSLFALLLLCAQDARAACNRAAGWTERIINMRIGNVLVTDEMPVGHVIRTQRFEIPIQGASQQMYRCPGGGYVHGVMLQGAPVAGMPNVYSTSVRGIGIRLSRMITSGPGTVYYPHDLRVASIGTGYAPSYFVVEVIKTAAVTGNGSLAPGVYTRYYGDGDRLSAITTHLDANGLTIISPSCTVDPGSRNIQVPFGRVPKNALQGVGSTAADRQFDIRLNCKPGQNAHNTVYLRQDATADASGAQGVLRVTPGAASATGVGIRLLDGSRQPVRLGQDAYVGPSMDGVYTLSYIAQYYQTGQRVTPGAANGIATFTIEYK